MKLIVNDKARMAFVAYEEARMAFVAYEEATPSQFGNLKERTKFLVGLAKTLPGSATQRVIPDSDKSKEELLKELSELKDYIHCIRTAVFDLETEVKFTKTDNRSHGQQPCWQL